MLAGVDVGVEAMFDVADEAMVEVPLAELAADDEELELSTPGTEAQNCSPRAASSAAGWLE